MSDKFTGVGARVAIASKKREGVEEQKLHAAEQVLSRVGPGKHSNSSIQVPLHQAHWRPSGHRQYQNFMSSTNMQATHSFVPTVLLLLVGFRGTNPEKTSFFAIKKWVGCPPV